MRTQRNEHDTTSDRISRLETAVESINDQLGVLSGAIAEIQRSVNRAGKTDWGTIFGGALVVLALYAASIHPLEEKITGLRGDLNKMGDVQYETGLRNQAVKDAFLKTQDESRRNADDLLRMRDARLNTRLAVIEWRLDHSDRQGLPAR